MPDLKDGESVEMQSSARTPYLLKTSAGSIPALAPRGGNSPQQLLGETFIPDPPTIVLNVSGGMVQDVYCSTPEAQAFVVDLACAGSRGRENTAGFRGRARS